MLNYYFKTQKYSCVKTFWPVLNNQTVIDSNSNINSRNNAILICMFIFVYSIYKNCTPEIQISQRRVDLFCFNVGDKKFIGITRFGALWTNSQQKYRLYFGNRKCRLYFNKTSFKLAINFLVGNCYFTLCRMCFCQFIGIALLFNPDPFIVNLFLYYYEQECLLQTEKWDLQKA